MWLNYQEEEKKFVVTKPVDNSLAKFLSSSDPPLEKQPSLVSTLPVADTSRGEVCEAHGRPQELICVDDKQRICTQCALFGAHKGHDVRMEEEVTKEIQLKVEVLMEMFQAMGVSCEELTCTDNYERQYNVFKQKQQETKEKIQDKFKEWRNALRAVEMRAIDGLYQAFQQFEDRFAQARAHNGKMMSEGQAWMDWAK